MKKNVKGITLIALVVTIVVLLILAGISISMLTGENGIIKRAVEAKEESEKAEEIEAIGIAYNGVMADNKGNGVTDRELENELHNNGRTDAHANGENPIIVSFDSGREYSVESNGKINETEYIPSVDIGDIFDPNGKNEEDDGYDNTKLHIGDFVDYDAGIWKQEEIDQIKTGIKGSEQSINEEAPQGEFQFGGFSTGMNKNESLINYTKYYDGYGSYEVENKSDTYIREITENGEQQRVTGWRVFDINENSGEITLISAGCPEKYYIELQGGTSKFEEKAYANEYILTGNINSKWTEMTQESVKNAYTKRNWDAYINENQKAIEARILTKKDLDNWYEKYVNYTSTDVSDKDIYKLVYDTKYESMIDNNVDYWLSTSPGASNFYYLWHFSETSCYVNNYQYGFITQGVRVLVTLSSNTKVSEKPIETKTIVNPDSEKTWTYNVWKIM